MKNLWEWFKETEGAQLVVGIIIVISFVLMSVSVVVERGITHENTRLIERIKVCGNELRSTIDHWRNHDQAD